jgi:single-stranded DNA-binding protein
MTVSVLVSGALFRAPESKNSQSGKTYVKATIRTEGTTDSAFDYWNILSFSDGASSELMLLTDGDRVAVQGKLKVEVYNGRLQRTVFVDQVLALRARKKRKDGPEPSKCDPEPARETDLNDPIPF